MGNPQRHGVDYRSPTVADDSEFLLLPRGPSLPRREVGAAPTGYRSNPVGVISGNPHANRRGGSGGTGYAPRG